MLRRSHSCVQNFDIELSGNSGRNDDIIILSGPPLEASANHFFGNIVLSTIDRSLVRRISIKLVGTLRLRWSDMNSSKKYPVKYEKELYSQEFSDFEIPGEKTRSNPASHKTTPVASLSNLASYFGKHKHSPSHTGTSSATRDTSPKMSRSSSATSLINLAGPYIGNNGVGARSSSYIHLADSQAAANLPAHDVPAGIHEFPFDLVIPGDISESIEGNKYGQLTYWLVATVDRGKTQQRLTAKRHIRIVRTVGLDNYDVAHTVSIENTWPNKVEYRIDVPCRAVALGTQLKVNFILCPIDKGLKLGRIRGEIVEYVSIATPLSPSREEERVVGHQFYEVPEDFDHFADEWVFSHMIDIPRSLSQCTQDAFVEPYIKINHKFRCFISLINKDGHTSELRASLPITIYISPHIYVVAANDENSIANLGAHHGVKLSKHHGNPVEVPIFNVERQDRRGMTTPNNDVSAPPIYSDHVYDRLYSAVPTPSESPIQSGAASPRFSPSRPNSPPQTLGSLDPQQQAQLQAGLRALALNRNSSLQSIPKLSRGNSGINVQAISRVPSYEEALNETAASKPAPVYPEDA